MSKNWNIKFIFQHMYMQVMTYPHAFFQLTIMLTSQKNRCHFLLTSSGFFWGGAKYYPLRYQISLYVQKSPKLSSRFFMIAQKVIEVLTYSLQHMKSKVLGFKVQQTRYCYLCFFHVFLKNWDTVCCMARRTSYVMVYGVTLFKITQKDTE